MTSLTLLTLVVIAYGVLGRHGYGRALALGGVCVAGAAVAFGTTAVPVFYFVAVGAAVALALDLATRRGGPRGLPPGVPLLLVFTAWAVLVTLVSPFLFDGLSTQVPAVGISRLTAGVFTSSNLAQTGYLLLAVCVVVFVARSPHSGPGLIGITTGAIVLLSLWRWFNQNAGIPFPEGVFDNSPSLAYIESAPGGVERFRGILSEPSSLAGFTLVAASYMLARTPYVRGLRRIGAFAVAGIAIFLGSISTSTTFFVAGAMVAIAAAITFVVRLVLRWTGLSPVFGVIACVLVVVSLYALPVVAGVVAEAVDDKVGTASFDERSMADQVSYGIVLDTFGMGVGLGANRASSFFPGLLSVTGVIGTLLFALVVVGLVRRGYAVPEYRPVAWALVTLLVVKVIAGPDLSDTSGVLWVSLGLLAKAAMIAEIRIPLRPPWSARVAEGTPRAGPRP